MGTIQLAGAVADPQHVCRAVVPATVEAVLAHEGLLVVQQQGFVCGEETGFAQLRHVIHATGTHELQRLVDSRSQLVIFLRHLRVGDEVQVPLVDLM